jgi:hypothetical protein
MRAQNMRVQRILNAHPIVSVTSDSRCRKHEWSRIQFTSGSYPETLILFSPRGKRWDNTLELAQ